MNHPNKAIRGPREHIAPHTRPPTESDRSPHDGDIKILTSQLIEATHSLDLETERRSDLEEVLRMQNVVLVRTLASLVPKESESAKFLDRLLDAITLELEVHSVAVWSLDDGTGLATLEKTAYNGTVLSGVIQLKHPLAGREGKRKSRLFAQALKAGPIQIDDVSSTSLLEPAIRRWLKLQKVKSMLCVPLRIGGKMTGALTVRLADFGGMLTSKSNLVYALADLVSLAIRLDGILERRQEFATMRERSRLASELHDSLSQNLTAAVLQMESAEQALTPGAEKARSHISLAESMVRLSQEELRRSVWALRPLPLEGHTLPDALRQLAAHLGGHKNLNVQFTLRGKPFALSEEIEMNFLRIAQEAVNNAIRHAMATRIQIHLAYSARRKVLTISDDGVGFKTVAAKSWHGAGLENMRARATRIGARFSVHSVRTRGTRVTVILPLLTT
jgi:signal transduction histidine kinase